MLRITLRSLEAFRVLEGTPLQGLPSASIFHIVRAFSCTCALAYLPHAWHQTMVPVTRAAWPFVKAAERTWHGVHSGMAPFG